ncbi:MAG: response regulator transcription factor [Candidatus Omnitrophica bacterium]|nr:response regulator transcription factor [Candidatus Omnitrophota bacterium]
MAKKRILVVEDDRDIHELIRYNLEREGFEVLSLYDGALAVDVAATRKPDLVLLDLMLPEYDGLDICRQLKNEGHTKHIPIIMITAKGTESDVVAGLSMGADDYIPKPFSPQVLLARIKAVFRRGSTPQEALDTQGVRGWGDLVLDLPKHKVSFKNHAVALTSIEFAILEFLSRSPGRVFSREQILDSVWKEGKFIIDRAVDVHIRGLRKKLGPAQDYIETVRGVGYRFKETE